MSWPWYPWYRECDNERRHRMDVWLERRAAVWSGAARILDHVVLWLFRAKLRRLMSVAIQLRRSVSGRAHFYGLILHVRRERRLLTSQWSYRRRTARLSVHLRVERTP